MNDQQSKEDHDTVDDIADAIRAVVKVDYPPMDDEELSEMWAAAMLDRAIAPNDIIRLLASVETLTADLAAADDEAVRLRDVLAFYADGEGYKEFYGHTDFAEGDGGKRAQYALGMIVDE